MTGVWIGGTMPLLGASPPRMLMNTCPGAIRGLHKFCATQTGITMLVGKHWTVAGQYNCRSMEFQDTHKQSSTHVYSNRIDQSCCNTSHAISSPTPLAPNPVLGHLDRKEAARCKDSQPSQRLPFEVMTVWSAPSTNDFMSEKAAAQSL